MFCPKCGNPDQEPDTYCRQCGVFLPDLSKPFKPETPPEENLTVNTVLSLMTVIVSFTLAILLYLILAFRSNTHPLIYVTASLLIAMGAWHIQTFIRTRRLGQQWKRRNSNIESETAPVLGSVTTGKLLDQADFVDRVPASVTDHTTRHLSETRFKSS